jgi:hypothetical protein
MQSIGGPSKAQRREFPATIREPRAIRGKSWEQANNQPRKKTSSFVLFVSFVVDFSF